MKNALAAEELEVLRQFAAASVLLAFDYDGTLAPIVEDADQAYMRPATRELLWQLTSRYPVIVITGRAQPDALRRLRGVGVLEVVGNHGIEPMHASNRYAELVRRWHSDLERCVAAWPGVSLEDKIYSVAVHYRKARDPEGARAAILETAAGLAEARILGGKQVVNLVPRGAVDKGAALLREQQRLLCEKALYVGDDETDEDVFTRSNPDTLLGIRVGDKSGSAASHFIAEQSAIDDLLRILIDLRQEPDQGRRHGR